MSLPSAPVAPIVPALGGRRELEAAYTALLAEVERLRDAVTVAQATAKESALGAQVLANRIRATDAFAAGLASTLPDMADAIADLRALLAGNMR